MSRLRLFSGDTKTINVTVVDESGALKDITGSTIVWKLYLRGEAETAKVTKGISSGITLTDPTNGGFQISLGTSDTASLDGDTYEHECQVTDSSSKVQTIFRQPVIIKADLIV